MDEIQLSQAIAKLTKMLQPKERKKKDELKVQEDCSLLLCYLITLPHHFQERKWKEEEEVRLKDPEGWASQLRNKREVRGSLGKGEMDEREHSLLTLWMS